MRVLLVLAAVMAALAVCVTLAVAASLWWLARRNRVHPAARSYAPLTWLGSPARPARLHRRLRGAVRLGACGVSRRARPTVAGLLTELSEEAVRLDAQIVVAAHRTRPTRRAELDQLESRVAALEDAAARLVALGQRSGVGTAEPVDRLADITERVTFLEDAHGELDDLSHSPQLDAPSRPPQADAQPAERPPAERATRRDSASAARP